MRTKSYFLKIAVRQRWTEPSFRYHDYEISM